MLAWMEKHEKRSGREYAFKISDCKEFQLLQSMAEESTRNQQVVETHSVTERNGNKMRPPYYLGP